MIPRSVNPQGAVPLANVDITQDDFLVAQELATKPENPQPNPEINPPNTKRSLVSSTNEELLNEQIAQEITMSKKEDEKKATSPEDILKSIISKGEYIETREICGYKWELKALNQEELLEAFDKSASFKDSQQGQFSALMFEQIVHSIVSINDIPVTEFFPDKVRRSDFMDTSSYVKAVRRTLSVYLKKFPPTVIDELYNAYLEVETKRNEAVQHLKNS